MNIVVVQKGIPVRSRVSDKKSKRDELVSRKDYEPTLETLRRFAKMNDGKLTSPSGIVRRSSRGKWHTDAHLQAYGLPPATACKGKAK